MIDLLLLINIKQQRLTDGSPDYVVVDVEMPRRAAAMRIAVTERGSKSRRQMTSADGHYVQLGEPARAEIAA